MTATLADEETVPTLACGHPDDDPAVWHHGPDGEPVCAACCPECQATP